MISPSSITIPQGGSGTVVISTAVLSGTAQNLTLSITSSLPPGVVATFSPSVIPAGGSTILSLNVGNTIANTYTLTISAAGALGPTHTNTLTLVVTASDFTI